MFVSSLFHPSGTGEDGILYVIYERPTPPLVLAASLRSVDGDDSIGCSRAHSSPRWSWQASIRPQQPFPLPLTVDLTRPYVQLRKRYLPNDVVTLEVTVTLGDDNYDKNVRILMVPSPISVVIDGGHLRTVSSHQQLTLNASNSFDPDKRFDTSSMTFSWFCMVIDESKHSKRKRDVINRMGQQQKIVNLSRFRFKGNRRNRLYAKLRSNDDGQLDCSGFEAPFTDIDGPVVVIHPDQLTSGVDYTFRVEVTSSTESYYPVSIGYQEVSIVDDYNLPYINIRS